MVSASWRAKMFVIIRQVFLQYAGRRLAIRYPQVKRETAATCRNSLPPQFQKGCSLFYLLKYDLVQLIPGFLFEAEIQPTGFDAVAGYFVCGCSAIAANAQHQCAQVAQFNGFALCQMAHG